MAGVTVEGTYQELQFFCLTAPAADFASRAHAPEPRRSFGRRASVNRSPPRENSMKKELGTFLLLVLLCVVVAVLNPRFLAPANLQNMARLIGAYGIFSIGLGMVIITGGIDLSVGSVFALLGVLLSIMLVEWGWPWPLAVLATVGIATALGALHGVLITKVRV